MKVKNIMFSGFAAAILMGVVAEANAAPVAVASKGYVDSVTGKLESLNGAADEATNLVEAINVKQDKFTDGAGGSTSTGFISSVTQTGGAVTAGTTAFDTVIDDDTKDHENTAPTTKAVADAIKDVTYENGTDINIGADNKINATYASLDYESGTDEVDNADKLSEGYAVSYVRQVDGKVKIGAKQYNDTVSAAVAGTAAGLHAPSTKAVWNAIEGVSGQTTNLDLAAVGGDGKFVKVVSQADGQLSATATDFDTEITDETKNHENTTLTTKAVADALATKQNTLNFGTNLNYDSETNTLTATDTNTTYGAGTNITIDTDGNIRTKFPEMPGVCTETGVTCVLTSEGGAFKWGVLTQPVSNTTMDGTEAQAQAIEEPVTGDDTAIENPGV